jgi:cytidine deaminase
MEFGEDIQVIVADETGGYRVFGLQELLPEAFNSDDLG